MNILTGKPGKRNVTALSLTIISSLFVAAPSPLRAAVRSLALASACVSTSIRQVSEPRCAFVYEIDPDVKLKTSDCVVKISRIERDHSLYKVESYIARAPNGSIIDNVTMENDCLTVCYYHRWTDDKGRVVTTENHFLTYDFSSYDRTGASGVRVTRRW